MFDLTTDWWEIIARVTLIYVALLMLLRVSGKRQLGQLTPMDLLTILLLAEAVSPALTGEDFSAVAGLIAATTLLALTFLNGLFSYRWSWFERVSEGRPELLIEDGELHRDVMAREQITMQELQTAMRQHGLSSFSDVLVGMIEPSGQITFIRRPNRARTGEDSGEVPTT